MQLFYQPQITEGVLSLDTDESRHAIKVLRLKAGDALDLTDGQGHFYKAQITMADARKCGFQIVEKTSVPHNPVYRHIAIAPTKNIDRLEWFVEKAVEFGIDRISLVLCHHSERKVVKNDRLERKAISAMKQSLKAWLPQIDTLQPIEQFLKSAEADQKFMAYVDKDNPNHLKELKADTGHQLVLIGPEGDFSAAEVEMALELGYQKVSLGKSRLRTETAGIAAVHLLNL